MEKLTILLCGASGFIGSAFLKKYASQYKIISLPRNFTEIPEADVIINLAGSPIYRYWTKKNRIEIRDSRISITKRLVSLVLKQKVPPMCYIGASAIGFYGDRSDEILDDFSAPGTGFLPSVCLDWEMASLPIEKRGVRRVLARFGVVLGAGGMLQKLQPLLDLHLAGRIGDGNQWISWISLNDLLSSLSFIIQTPSVDGPVAVVSPHPIKQKDFIFELQDTMQSSWQLPLPGFLVRLVLGDFGKELLLSSARVTPKKLLDAGFCFQTPALHKTISDLK